MATTTYFTVEGEILGEDRAGTKRDYVPDPLGSVRALLNSSQSQTDTYSYWPYGETQASTGSSANPMRFIGSLGGRHDHANRSYFRVREFEKRCSRWLTVDPLWPSQPTYAYALNNPATYRDPSGTLVFLFGLAFFLGGATAWGCDCDECADKARDLGDNWVDTWIGPVTRDWKNAVGHCIVSCNIRKECGRACWGLAWGARESPGTVLGHSDSERDAHNNYIGLHLSYLQGNCIDLCLGNSSCLRWNGHPGSRFPCDDYRQGPRKRPRPPIRS